MKDPLNNKLSPYDILGVKNDADKKAIQDALGKAVALKRFSPLQAAKAKQCLLNTEDRLQEDFFLYENEDEKDIKLDFSITDKFKGKTEIEFNILKNFDEIDPDFLREIEYE